ncbi:hypothetical protein JW964_14995 [candidate division KSB1 bacterium]|nr:hypothetical protein [candidate division KSB1 bacterium]
MENKISVTHRRNFIKDLREQGVTVEEIARRAVEKFGAENLPAGYDKRQVSQDLKRERSTAESDRHKTQQRRDLVLKYWIEGHPPPEILTRVTTEMGVINLPQHYSSSHVRRDLERIKKEQYQLTPEHQQENQLLNKYRLEKLCQNIWEQASAGDLKAIELFLKIISKQQELTIVPPNLVDAPKNVLSLAEAVSQKEKSAE